MRVSDYIVEFLKEKKVTDCFTVVGGGAMYLNNSFGHSQGMHCTHFHHEQGAAIAAESYARYENKVAALCVTSGPGGTNAITGVLGGWLDSIPMFVVSGQVRYDTTARYDMRLQREAGLWGDAENLRGNSGASSEGDMAGGLAGYECNGAGEYGLRSLGDQEFDITKSVAHMCKYAVMLEDPEDIRYHLEKAWHLMTTGRPGPVWLDIPVNFQAAEINPKELKGYDEPDDSDGSLHENCNSDLDSKGTVNTQDSTLDPYSIKEVITLLREAKRPVIYAGGGVRISGAFDIFREVVQKLGVPVCTYWNSIDLMEDEDPLYCGRGGNMGDRAGNFAVQNSDLLLVLGSRLSIRQVGYNFSTWARAAKVIMVDIDKAEMNKHTIHVDLRIHADVKKFLEALCTQAAKEAAGKKYLCDIDEWRIQCITWKNKYPVVSQCQRNTGSDRANVYGFFRTLSERLPNGTPTAVSNGACCVAGHQSWCIKKGSRFINNNGVASMGYGLPAAIGLCISAGKRTTVCLEGDGSIMMNLQELQTIVTNKLPVKIFLINNEGYHSIRITQNNLFSDYSKVGIGPESGDLAFPEFEKIAGAFRIPYYKITSGDETEEVLDKVLAEEGPLLCEVFTDTRQVWEPKSSARREPDGTLTSPPLEDLAPFLPREELEKNMYI